MYTPITVLDSSREYDGFFRLTQKSRKLNYGYTPYTWICGGSIFSKFGQIFPLCINLYLETCTHEELSDLLNKEHFLTASIQYDERYHSTFISVMNLTISDLQDQGRKNLMLLCRNMIDVPSEEQYREKLIPCEIITSCGFNMQRIWHFFGADRTMCMNRRIETAANIIIPNRKISAGFVVGLEMICRDPYYEEDTEEKIRESEDLEGISITRF